MTYSRKESHSKTMKSNNHRIQHAFYWYLFLFLFVGFISQSLSHAAPVNLKFTPEIHPLTVSSNEIDSMGQSILVDMNGDGLDDIVAYNESIELFLGNPDGGFDPGVEISYKEKYWDSLGWRPDKPVDLLIHDWNNDS